MDWRKSSFSGTAGNCVELRQDLRAVRDSKSPNASLVVTREALHHLVAVVRHSEGM